MHEITEKPATLQAQTLNFDDIPLTDINKKNKQFGHHIETLELMAQEDILEKQINGMKQQMGNMFKKQDEAKAK